VDGLEVARTGGLPITKPGLAPRDGNRPAGDPFVIICSANESEPGVQARWRMGVEVERDAMLLSDEDRSDPRLLTTDSGTKLWNGDFRRSSDGDNDLEVNAVEIQT
jgi:hypothetical protein